MNKLVYLAAPFSHVDPAIMTLRNKHINAMTAQLLDVFGLTHTIYSPITHGGALMWQLADRPPTHGWWMQQCEPLVNAADELWLFQLHGWEDSKGVEMELQWWVDKGRPVTVIAPELLGQRWTYSDLVRGVDPEALLKEIELLRQAATNTKPHTTITG